MERKIWWMNIEAKLLQGSDYDDLLLNPHWKVGCEDTRKSERK